MLFGESMFIGLHPTNGDQPMHYAALDRDLRLVALDSGDLEAVLAFVAGQGGALVAINAPQGPERGLMATPAIRERFNLPPNGSTWTTWRVCEFELRQRNIRVPSASGMQSIAPGWLNHGFELYRRLRQIGYLPYIREDGPQQRSLLESQPQAAFSVLMDHLPFAKTTLEGRLQRQLVLYLQGLDIPDPMRALEELTRHHLLAGDLPLEEIYESSVLDALSGAFTGYLAANRPEEVRQVGDRSEGLITLPTSKLESSYK